MIPQKSQTHGKTKFVKSKYIGENNMHMEKEKEVDSHSKNPRIFQKGKESEVRIFTNRRSGVGCWSESKRSCRGSKTRDS